MSEVIEDSSRQTTRKARAFVVSTDGQISPLADLEEAEISKRDQQLEGDKKWIGSDNLAGRPYPASSFHFLWESNVMVWRCTKQIATDVAGLGHAIKVREDMPEDNAQYEKIKAFIKRPNPVMSFRRMNKAFILEHGITGNAAFQVVRSKDNMISEVFHMPSGDLWADKDGKKFCQKKGIEKVWFARYAMGKDGIPLILDPKTGKENKGLNIKDRANEILFYHDYYPKSRWYGVPDMLPTSGDIVTGLGIRDYNLAFFTNSGIPAYIVHLTGEWEDGNEEDETNSIQVIRDYMKNLKAAEKSHSTIVVEIPEGCEIKVEPVAVRVEEGSFKILKQMIDQDVLVAYSMPPFRIGIPVRVGSLAGNIAAELTTNYINGVVEPLQTDLEEIWSDQIFDIGLQCPNYQIKFKNLDIRDEVIEHEEDSTRIRTGTMTPNEYREKRGEKPYPGGDSFYMEAALSTVGEDDAEDD